MLIIIIYIVFIVGWLLLTFKSVEAWPFSSYPMFSQNSEASKTVVFCLGIEYENGKQIQWSSKQKELRKIFDTQIKTALKKGDSEQIKKTLEKYVAIFLDETNYCLQINRAFILTKGDTISEALLPYPSFTIKVSTLKQVN